MEQHTLWTLMSLLSSLQPSTHSGKDPGSSATSLPCATPFPCVHRQGFEKAAPAILEPVMRVEVTAPLDCQGTVIGDLNQRSGSITATEADADDVIITAEVPLARMFSYSTALRSMTQASLLHVDCGHASVGLSCAWSTC